MVWQLNPLRLHVLVLFVLGVKGLLDLFEKDLEVIIFSSD
jgi:hypothetical protein